MSPFVSKKQAKFLFARKPKIAEEFAEKTPSIKALPEKKGGNIKMAKKKVIKKAPKKPKLGTGARFKKLTSTLEKRGARDPKALAAWIGRKKYGAKRFGKLSAGGKK